MLYNHPVANEENLTWNPGERSFFRIIIDPETGKNTVETKVVTPGVLIQIWEDGLSTLKRCLWTAYENGPVEYELTWGKAGFLKKITVDDRKKIGVSLKIEESNPRWLGANYDEFGKLVGFQFEIFSKELGEYTLFVKQKAEGSDDLEVFALTGESQQLFREDLVEVLRVENRECLIEKIAGGLVRVRIGGMRGLSFEAEFREQIDNEQIFNLLGSDEPKDWKKVFELV